MSKSLISEIDFKAIIKRIQHVYQNDNRPWILGFSGGKDSTCMVQLVWNALSKLPSEKLTKKVYVISSNTLVEAPQIAERITINLDKIEKEAKKIGLPIETNLLRPPTSDTFWVRMLGLGYPAPTSMFRWCTDMLKISNADRFITDTVSKHGEAIVLLGMRKNESTTREQVMNLYAIKNSYLSRHSKFDSTYVFTPIEDLSAEDVWNFLLENKNPWGEENLDLLAMYQDANASECPLVIDTSTPSCGGGRFGCWTCTVVDNQSYLTNLIDTDKKNEWMEVLAELREELKLTQEQFGYLCKKCNSVIKFNRNQKEYSCPTCDLIFEKPIDAEKENKIELYDVWAKFREKIRRSGRVELKSHGDGYTPGPYKMEFRLAYLEKLLKGQVKIQKLKNDPDFELILEDEIHEIQKIWINEQGDWKNSVYEIYNRITGKNIQSTKSGLGTFGATEQELLENICTTHKVPFKLVSNLLSLELKSQSANRHSKIYDKIKNELSKEWRDVNDKKEFNKVMEELEKKRKIDDEVNKAFRYYEFRILNDSEKSDFEYIETDKKIRTLRDLKSYLKSNKKYSSINLKKIDSFRKIKTVDEYKELAKKQRLVRVD